MQQFFPKSFTFLVDHDKIFCAYTNGYQLMKRSIVAAFDFDGTLTRKDTLIPFLIHCLGTPKAMLTLLPSIPQVAQFYCGYKSRQEVKEALLIRAFDKWLYSDIQTQGISFAQQKIPPLLKAAAMQRLKWHKNKGHYCILISATLSCYLEPWAQEAGFDLLISSKLATPSPTAPIGTLSGANCWGQEKVYQLQAMLGPKDYTLYAYGDSPGDHALLSYADHPYYRAF
jgi:phosphatidylglycerophosphatase C